jgi:hypothetical protein
MIVEPDFLTHWKTQMLVGELDDPAAPLYVIALWAHCQQRRTAGFERLGDNALKAICRYPGDGAKLRAALEACGFIDRTDTGFEVHGWDEVNAKLIANWTNGPKGGRPRKAVSVPAGETHGKPSGNPKPTQQNPQLTDREEKIDKIERRGGNAHEAPAVAENPPAPALAAPVELPEPPLSAPRMGPPRELLPHQQVQKRLSEVWPSAPRAMTGIEMHDLHGSLSVLCELSDEDWTACSAWNAAPLRELGREKRWPRDRAEFVRNAGQVVELVRTWWKAGGKRWHAGKTRQQPKPQAAAPVTNEQPGDDSALAEFLKAKL